MPNLALRLMQCLLSNPIADLCAFCTIFSTSFDPNSRCHVVLCHVILPFQWKGTYFAGFWARNQWLLGATFVAVINKPWFLSVRQSFLLKSGSWTNQKELDIGLGCQSLLTFCWPLCPQGTDWMSYAWSAPTSRIISKVVRYNLVQTCENFSHIFSVKQVVYCTRTNAELTCSSRQNYKKEVLPSGQRAENKLEIGRISYTN